MDILEFSSITIQTEIIQIKLDRVLVVTFNGQITNTNAYEINANISNIFKENLYNIILDLTNLQYINSIGVATLLSIIRTVEQKKGKITIGGLNHFLENVLKLMDLPKQVTIYSTKELAIDKWS